MAEDNLLDIGFDLRHAIGQLVVGIVDFFRTHAILYRNRNGDEHIIFSLGLHGQSDLIHAQTYYARHGIEERPLPVQTRLGHTKKLAEASDHGDFGRAYGEKARHDEIEHDDSREPQRNPVQFTHLISSTAPTCNRLDYTGQFKV